MARMPQQKPGRSKQDYQTPPEFLAAVKRKLGITAFACDLAATAENAVASLYYDLDTDALHPDSNWRGGWGEDWESAEWNWLNPPFADITPWVEKAWNQSRDQHARTAVLVPLSTADWWKAWVHGKCTIVLLHGRITFVGETTAYPKDCALLLYTPEHPTGMVDYELWSWRQP